MSKRNPIRAVFAIVFLLQPLISFALQLHAGVQINENSFDELTKSGLWFIENFSPFCPHCKKFAPTWIDVVENMKPYEAQGLKLGQIDCIAQGDLCIKLNVDFYPQMKLYEDGTYIEHYTGEKTVESIKSYLESKLEAYKVTHKPKDTLKSEPAVLESSILEPDKIHHKPIDIFDSEPAVLEPEISKSTIDELTAESPLATEHVPLVHQADAAHSDPQLDLENVPNKDGKVLHLNSHNWPRYTHLHHGGEPILIHYHTAWCKECRTLTPMLVEAALELQNEVNVGEFDCDKKANQFICAENGITEFPALVLYHNGTKLATPDRKSQNAIVDFARTNSKIRGAHDVGLLQLDHTIRTIPLFFLFLYSSHTPLSTVKAVETVGKSFGGHVLILKSDHADLFEKLSFDREHAQLIVFKEYDPIPWSHVAVRDSDGEIGKTAWERSLNLATAIRHWVAINSIPLLDQLSNNNFYRVFTTGAHKLAVVACLSGMVTDEYGQLDVAKSNPKSIQLKEDMKIWAHQWRKSQEARGASGVMIDWVWVDAERWSEWLYSTYGVNLPPPNDDPKQSSSIVVIDAHSHKYYDTQEDGYEIQFKAASVFQVLLGVEMNKLKGKLAGTAWGRTKLRFSQFKNSISFLFRPSWMIFWLILFGMAWFSIKSFKSSTLDSKSRFFTQSSKNGFHSSPIANDVSDTAHHFHPGIGQVFGLTSNLPSFKAD